MRLWLRCSVRREQCLENRGKAVSAVIQDASQTALPLDHDMIKWAEDTKVQLHTLMTPVCTLFTPPASRFCASRQINTLDMSRSRQFKAYHESPPSRPVRYCYLNTINTKMAPLAEPNLPSQGSGPYPAESCNTKPNAARALCRQNYRIHPLRYLHHLSHNGRKHLRSIRHPFPDAHLKPLVSTYSNIIGTIKPHIPQALEKRSKRIPSLCKSVQYGTSCSS